MEIKTKQILNVLIVISWIIFFGVCIELGGFITNAVFALVNPASLKYLWQQADLTNLYQYDTGYYLVILLHIIMPMTFKAFLFYLIIRILHSKKLNMSEPFNKEMVNFVSNLSYVALLIGIFSAWGANYAEWLAKKGIEMPDLQNLRLGGADVWVFMGVILFVIAQIFKRGVEIQAEHELTV
ncbi:DUF2975 domain-containing protein [Pedobacter sp. UC225_65]|uniref:DUF2975 domain-containing protein n=1 Tax=Pedobacter sp. UC225_65 TaxID=3350173 RepID=UPI00366B9A88